jgi:hypothetical protein
MNAAIELGAVSAVAAAAAALVAALVWRKLIPAAWSEHSALALGVALGFFAGYWLLPDWAPLWPGRPTWQWLPYLALAAALPGAVPGKANWPVRWPAFAAVAALAAWLLVPTWNNLYPPRLVSIGLLAVYLVVFYAAIDALPDRVLGRWFAGSLTASAFVLAVVLLVFGASAKIAQVGAAAAFALAGGFAATIFAGLNSPQATRGHIPVYVILAGGFAYVGAIEPTTPRYAILLVPLVPLVWWLMAIRKVRVPAESKPG